MQARDFVPKMFWFQLFEPQPALSSVKSTSTLARDRVVRDGVVPRRRRQVDALFAVVVGVVGLDEVVAALDLEPVREIAVAVFRTQVGG